MRRFVTPGRLAIAGLALLAVVLALMVIPSGEVIFLPDAAHPVAPLVTFHGSRDPKHGGVYFVDVFERKATLLERLFGGLDDGPFGGRLQLLVERVGRLKEGGIPAIAFGLRRQCARVAIDTLGTSAPGGGSRARPRTRADPARRSDGGAQSE